VCSEGVKLRRRIEVLNGPAGRKSGLSVFSSLSPEADFGPEQSLGKLWINWGSL
jgi:hypothetical protein